MDNSKQGIVPIFSDTILCKTDCLSIGYEIKRMSRIPYASAVGSIMYAVTCTSSDVTYVIILIGIKLIPVKNIGWL